MKRYMLINRHLCVCLMTLIAAFVPASTLAGDNAVKFYLDNISVTGMPADVNCTPKVRQKTFGVQFVYEKDI